MPLIALKALLLVLGISISNSLFAGNLARLGKLTEWTSMYFGVTHSQSSGLGSRNINDLSLNHDDYAEAGKGLVLGTAWFDRFSTEFRILDLANYSDSSIADLNDSQTVQPDFRMAEVSALYYMGQDGSLDHYSKRNSVSPFVRLGLASVSPDTLEFGLGTSGNDYLSIGAGVDLMVLGLLGIRAEVQTLHADYVFGAVSLFINFD